ncbi:MULTISPECIES: EamA family transporter [Clostridia]|uniref:EamA family transporter n=1 Tax=Clostridia TaxID=186801 RepID=UPI0018F37E5F|nr:EamA family transporter [Clostridium sp. 1xD42-85]
MELFHNTHTIFSKDRTQIISVWKNKQVAISLLIFGLFGMLAFQYTYMVSIHYGNATVATLLQYLAPVMIIIYLLIRKQTTLTKQDILTVALALIGCYFLHTNGNLSELSVPVPAMV